MRRRYLVSYDISDDKRRDAVFRLMRAWGDHAQYSVFFSELSAMELATLRAKLSAAINHAQDQVLLLDLGPYTNPLGDSLECLGRAYHPLSRVLVV